MEDYYKILALINDSIDTLTDYQTFYDLYSIAAYNLENELDEGFTVQCLVHASKRLLEYIPTITDTEESNRFYALHREILRLASPYDFDSYLLFMEWERELPKKFYLPRRKQLKCIVDMLQDLEDDKLDMVLISQPPGTGKSTLGLFFLTWVSGRNPNLSNLVGSHSDTFDKQAYDECLAFMDERGEYNWKEVFPHLKVGVQNAKDRMYDVVDKGKTTRTNRKFKTLEFTSLGSGNAGVYRAQNYLYCDDLIKNMEVAMSPERLDKVWQQYTDDLRQRKQGTCKEIHIATHWSVHDVISRLKDKYMGTGRVGVISLPALDENDESNFDYPFNLGFSTEMYHQQRDIMDEFSWKALFMNQPIEREGLVYPKDTLRRFFSLPDSEPDAIIAVCDTKDKGKDYAVLPVAYKYGQDFFIGDVICDNGLPDTVNTRLALCLIENRVQCARFEANNAGSHIARDIDQMVKQKNGRCSITTKTTTANKETKILSHSGWVKEHCLFRDDSLIKPGTDYFKFIQFLTGYTTAGKNAHDDCPDAMAMLSEYAQTFEGNRIEVFTRPW